jgi:dynein heavy chain 1
MFKVFSFFKPLFSRPRIRVAIREYQNQILQQVSKDIQALKEKFLLERENERSNILSGLRDFPTVSNNITWANQIKKKVNVYQERVRQVLGDDFDQDVGSDLHNKALALEKKLDDFINHNCNEWLNKINQVNVGNEKEKSVLDIIQRLNNYELVVNFNMQLFEILKEKPNLERHGLRPSITVTYKLNDLKQLYPVARSIQESLRTFQYTNSKITDKFVKLIAQKKNEA